MFKFVKIISSFIFLGVVMMLCYHLYLLSNFKVTLQGGGESIHYYIDEYHAFKEVNNGKTYIVLLLEMSRPWTLYYFQYPKHSWSGYLYLVFDENNILEKDSIFLGPSSSETKNIYNLDGQAGFLGDKLADINLSSKNSNNGNISFNVKKIDLSEAKQAEISNRDLWLKNTYVDYLR